MRLYRGIAVPEASVDATIAATRENGLLVEGRFWSGLVDADLRPRLELLWLSPDLSTELTRPIGEPHGPSDLCLREGAGCPVLRLPPQSDE